MHVKSDPLPELAVDELRLYTLREIAERAHRSERELRRDLRRETCPLVLRLSGKRKVADAESLRRYLAWLWDRAL